MEVTEQAGMHVLHPTGDLTIFEAAEFREALLTLIKHDGPIELDLSDVERMDSSGIQLLVSAVQENRLSIAGLTADVSDKMAGVGCAQFMKNSEQ